MLTPGHRVRSHTYDIRDLPILSPDPQHIGVQMEHGLELPILEPAQDPVLLQGILLEIPFVKGRPLLLKAVIP